MPRFLVTRAAGAAWDAARPIRQQAGWDAHAAFMDGLADEGFVAFGGPAVDAGEVVLIVDAPDAATVRARLALDPWTPARLVRVVEVEPWTVWLGSDERLASAARRPLYLVAYRPGPRWAAGIPRREQAGWDAHAAFMDDLVERGVVVLGGPLDEQRALVVFQHDDEPALRRRLAADPWHDGVLAVDSVRRWTVWLGAERRAAI